MHAVTPKLIAIAGGSGAGKTWLARWMEDRFSPNLVHVAMDEFYRDRSHLSPAKRAGINYDHPRAIDWERVEQFLADCRGNRPTGLPLYDFSTHCRLPGEEVWLPRPLVLVEGLWPLLKPGVRRHFDLKVFLACSAELRLQRRLARDVSERGRSAADVAQQFLSHVLPMHDQFVEPQRRWADLVVEEPVTPAGLEALQQAVRTLTPADGPLRGPRWQRSIECELTPTSLSYP
jgi:uridine kinase